MIVTMNIFFLGIIFIPSPIGLAFLTVVLPICLDLTQENKRRNPLPLRIHWISQAVQELQHHAIAELRQPGHCPRIHR